MPKAVSFLAGFFLLIATTTGGAAEAAALTCHGAQKPELVAQLLFGRDIGHRLGVSEAAWEEFLAGEITPRFPEGLTVINATGQWRDPSGWQVRRDPSGWQVRREPSKIVIIVLPGKGDDQARVDAIVAAYKRRFHQQSVGVIVQPACASF